jgi:hypothetical protein
LIVPSTIDMPRDGSFALAFLGRVRVHDPGFSFLLGRNNLALKRIVDLVSCSVASFIYSHSTKQQCCPGQLLIICVGASKKARKLSQGISHGLREAKRLVRNQSVPQNPALDTYRTLVDMRQLPSATETKA